MASQKLNYLPPEIASDYFTNKKDWSYYLADRMLDQSLDNLLDNNENKWKATCMSGLKSRENNGLGFFEGDAERVLVNPIGPKYKLRIKIRRQGADADIPNPFSGEYSWEEAQEVLMIHPWAESILEYGEIDEFPDFKEELYVQKVWDYSTTYEEDPNNPGKEIPITMYSEKYIWSKADSIINYKIDSGFLDRQGIYDTLKDAFGSSGTTKVGDSFEECDQRKAVDMKGGASFHGGGWALSSTLSLSNFSDSQIIFMDLLASTVSIEYPEFAAGGGAIVITSGTRSLSSQIGAMYSNRAATIRANPDQDPTKDPWWNPYGVGGGQDTLKEFVAEKTLEGNTVLPRSEALAAAIIVGQQHQVAGTYYTSGHLAGHA